LGDDGYHLRARAWTMDGEIDPSPAEVFFVYDTIPPVSAVLIAPTGGTAVLPSPRVTLDWETVAPDGGSTLAYVVQLDGLLYTTTRSVYTVTSIADGLHVWGVQVFDAAGNRSEWVTDTFSIRRRWCWLPLVMRDFGGTCSYDSVES